MLDADSMVAGLKSVNDHLISEDEISYVQTVMRVCAHAGQVNELDAPADVELFSIMCALSEVIVFLGWGVNSGVDF